MAEISLQQGQSRTPNRWPPSWGNLRTPRDRLGVTRVADGKGDGGPCDLSWPGTRSQWCMLPLGSCLRKVIHERCFGSVRILLAIVLRVNFILPNIRDNNNHNNDDITINKSHPLTKQRYDNKYYNTIRDITAAMTSFPLARQPPSY